MLRITGGFLKGRRIGVSARGSLRPTQERVREALFSMLAARIAGCRFLDLYAGSGIVALEAWSRGAAEVTLVESDRRVCGMLRAAVRELVPSSGGSLLPRVVCEDVARFLKRASVSSSGIAYDIVFTDPPYMLGDAGCRHADNLAGWLSSAGLPAPGGLWILECRARNAAPVLPPPWTLVDERVYGDARLAFFRRAAGAGMAAV